MTLIDKYLAAVAAQLPAASRDDVVAELRDDIMSRIEDREAGLGRTLTDDEVEAILREVGHPLAVAGRFGSGPQHLVGPELFPWWLFGVKVGLAVLVGISLLSVFVKLVDGQNFGQAIAQGFHGFFGGGVTLVGIATIAGYIFERQTPKPEFITNWKVKDLGFFEVARFDAEGVNRAFTSGAGVGPSVKVATTRPKSPVGRALASAVGVTVMLLWWIGAIRFGGVPLGDWVVEIGGVDYTQAVRDTVTPIFWPVVVYAVWRILFDLFRASNPRAVRPIALGDIALAVARGVFGLWLMFGSPVGRMLDVTSLQSVFDRLRDMFRDGQWDFSAIVIIILASVIIDAAFRILISAWRFVTGRDRRLEA